MSEGNEPPEDSKGEPTEDETGCKDQHCPSPLNIHHCGENVSQVSSSPLGYVALNNVAFAILHYHPLAHPPRTPSVLPVSSIKKNNSN